MVVFRPSKYSNDTQSVEIFKVEDGKKPELVGTAWLYLALDFYTEWRWMTEEESYFYEAA